MPLSMNYNLALSNNFKLSIYDSQEFNYFMQSVSIPSISLPEVEVSNMGHEIWVEGEQISYELLDVNFLISEDFVNYIYLHNWITQCRDKDFVENNMKDITINILNNNKLKDLTFTFHGAFPTNLGTINLESNIDDTTPLTCSATFRYQWFSISNDTLLI